LKLIQAQITKLINKKVYYSEILERPAIFVPLTTPLTSTSWDGDSFSTTAKTLIDLSAVFGVPDGISAVLMNVMIRDSGSSGTDCLIKFAPSGVDGNGIMLSCLTIDDRWNRTCYVIPCDANGDIYYQIAASGSGTMDVYLQIWGYWL
jgi:hypothetical protein